MLTVTAASGFGSSPPSGPTTITGSSDNWTGATANFTFSGDDIEHFVASGTNAMYTGGSIPVVLSGNFTISWLLTAEANSWYIGVFPVSEVGSFSTTVASGNMSETMTNSWYWNGESTAFGGASTVTKNSTSGLTGGDILKVIRTNEDTIDLHVNGSSHTLFNGSGEQDSSDLYFCFGGNHNHNFDNFLYVYNE